MQYCAGKRIEHSIFSFIWKYSKREQLGLLAITIILFPLLYLTLELPKRIINDAIGAENKVVAFWGIEIGQVPFLALLCILFLFSVLGHGLVKMRINTIKGILAERMLRRFRYDLINRILRFPRPYFQQTSQGELVSMVTSESEPLGGIMGDAISQPVLQAGQMLTILSFLFLQSRWFGLAAVALIPVQAWLIPKLQKQVNLLNKSRIKEVRQLAAEIGESAAGATELRLNYGWRYNRAIITDRLGRLFDIRVRIYQKKFFMKFLNNFISQLTPFFFFSIGGYLVIQNAVTLGALVAALAAYKDLSSPWKELLAYYNRMQDMSLRWEAITERFAPGGMIDAALIEGQPEEKTHLAGDVILQDLTVHDIDGTPVLENLNATFSKGTQVAIQAPNQEDRDALSQILTREITPSSGGISVAGHPLAGVHQSAIASRIGYASSHPYIFKGTIGENILMSLRNNPDQKGQPKPDGGKLSAQIEEAMRAGNSADCLAANWVDTSLAGFENADEMQLFWRKLLEIMDTRNALFNRGLEQKIDLEKHPELARRIVELRPDIAEKMDAAGLNDLFTPLDRGIYNLAFPIGENLLFAIPSRKFTQHELAKHEGFIKLLREFDLEKTMLDLGHEVVDLLFQTFGTDKTDHPLFLRLGLDREGYKTTVAFVHNSRGKKARSLKPDEKAMIMAIPFLVPADYIGPIMSTELQDRILKISQAKPDVLKTVLKDIYVPLDRSECATGLTVLENAIFGKIHAGAAAKVNILKELVAEVLVDAGVKALVGELIYNMPTGLGGANISSLYAEHLAFCRAAIKRPDILVLNQVMASLDPESRAEMFVGLREIMPETTLVFLEENVAQPHQFDTFYKLEHGRIQSEDAARHTTGDSMLSADLTQKLMALEQAELFAGMDRAQLRILAFSARWFSADAGEIIFSQGDDPADGAYLITEGEAGFYRPEKDGQNTMVNTAGPGSVVGEMSLIRKGSRALSMRANTNLKALRIGKEEFIAVVENDATTAFRLLQTFADYSMDHLKGG